MWELIDSPAHIPFFVAAFLVLFLLAIELLGFFFGGMGGFLDSVLPDSLIDADFDADVDMDFNGDMSLGLKALDWLYVGRIPTIILLVLLISSFSAVGFALQHLSLIFLGHYLSPWLASFDALVISFPVTKLFASLLYPIMPKEETSAVTGDSLVGHPASIAIGYAGIGSPAEAKIIDDFGQSHYVMVEPDPNYSKASPSLELVEDPSNTAVNNTFTFGEADKLIITKKVGNIYLVKKL